ncbi:spore-associated protein A [Nocardiopsis flavescens]|uniref:Spore-associated protein A n=1 Tax=Nocardiopsis flavescens TaxID=758803 RepID=A0A1M6N5F0_9ACTN|nr:spore-associated protein A [Nocardiopsis flavescens]SHJ90856.1 hypothetical protein SAMN05421803_11167 [Nocardiopsis flavescens]
MFNRFRPAALIAAAVAMTTIGLASPAAADDPVVAYNGVCGSGYGVVNFENVGTKGTVYVTYNNANGNNCAVTVRAGGGDRVWIAVGIKRTNDAPSEAVQEEDLFYSYAGPVYLHAAGQCIDWFGSIDGTNANRNETNCG